MEKSGKADLNESLNVTYSNSLNADSAEVEFNIFSQNQLNIPLNIYLTLRRILMLTI